MKRPIIPLGEHAQEHAALLDVSHRGKIMVTGCW